jgi:hypothetical protein
MSLPVKRAFRGRENVGAPALLERGPLVVGIAMESLEC